MHSVEINGHRVASFPNLESAETIAHRICDVYADILIQGSSEDDDIANLISMYADEDYEIVVTIRLIGIHANTMWLKIYNSERLIGTY